MIEQTITSILPLDNAAIKDCQERIDNLTKPLNSLQGFENLAVQLAGITGNPRPRDFKASLVLMAGDEGISEEIERKGAKELVQDFYQEISPIHVLAEHVLAQVTIVDIGAAADLSDLAIQHEKTAYGTKNSKTGPAMRQDEALQAVAAGIKIAQQEMAKGASVLGISGIRSEDDCLASLAVIAQHSKKSAQELTGFDHSPQLVQQTKILEEILKNNAPCSSDPWDIMSKVGNFEIAGLVGVILGASAGKTAVVLDGLLSAAAALLAVNLAPNARFYLIGSHQIQKPAHKEALELLKLPAYLDLGLTLGQGAGALLGISLLRASLHMLNDMKTFNEAKVAVAEDGPGVLKQKI